MAAANSVSLFNGGLLFACMWIMVYCVVPRDSPPWWPWWESKEMGDTEGGFRILRDCPECHETLRSIKTDMNGLHQEAALISNAIATAMQHSNCTSNTSLPDHHWSLDGSCSNQKSPGGHQCTWICTTQVFDPLTSKSPKGRASRQLSLRNWLSACAALIDESQGDTVDLGDWTGSCVSDPERCRAGLSFSIWLWVETLRPKDLVHILHGGRFDGNERGVALFGRYHEDRRGFALSARMRDSSNSWSLDTRLLPLRTWIHFGLSWSSREGLRAFVNGTNAIHSSEHTSSYHPPPEITRLTIGVPTPDSLDQKHKGVFAIAHLQIYLTHLSEKEMAQIFHETIKTIL